jgi:hypothetical protein
MERRNTSVLAVQMRDAEGFAFDFLVYLPGNSAQVPRTSGLRVGFFTFPRYSCDAHRTPVPHLIRTISAFFFPPRISVNPFFSSPSTRRPLRPVYGTIRTYDPFFPADLCRNFFLIFNFQPPIAASPRSNVYHVIIVLDRTLFPCYHGL